MVDLGGYVIILVETNDKRVKLYGSPADKADLEVADEILEINGKPLQDSSHTEVINHIHNVGQAVPLKHFISKNCLSPRFVAVKLSKGFHSAHCTTPSNK